MRRLLGDFDGLFDLTYPVSQVGLFADTSYRSQESRLEREDCVLLYTDGLDVTFLAVNLCSPTP
jgi:hypothetical protein